MSLRRSLFLFLAAAVAGCASDGSYESRPAPPLPPASTPGRPPAPVQEPPERVPPPARVIPPAAPPAIPSLPYPAEREGPALVSRLLPAKIADRSGWATDILAAISALRIRLLPENICAAIAVIEQESSFHADPVVPNLARIVWQRDSTNGGKDMAFPKVDSRPGDAQAVARRAQLQGSGSTR
jgi:hypothetical protein